MLRNDRNSILLAERERHVPRGVVTAHPLVVARALGAHVWDVEGRRYLDFVAGIGVLNVGHNHPRVVAAVSAQLQAVTHTAFQVAASEPYIALAARLNRLVGDGEVVQDRSSSRPAPRPSRTPSRSHAHTPAGRA